MSDNLTREEMACFRTALALVVVKKRLYHKQQQQQQSNDHDQQEQQQNNNKKKNTWQDDNDNEANHRHPNPGKKLRTMDSLIFPWTNACHDETEPRVSDSDSDSDMMVATRLQQAQSKQRDHLQGIMATAIRTAMCLVPNTPNQQQVTAVQQQQQQRTKNRSHCANVIVSPTPPLPVSQQQQVAAWSTLEALSSHIAQQVSFALQLAAKATATATTATTTTTTNTKTNTAANSKTNVPSQTLQQPSLSLLAEHWVADWIRDHLRQLLPVTTQSLPQQQPKQQTNHLESIRYMDATFLVWHGILLGGFDNAFTSSTSASSCLATTNNHTNNRNSSSSSSHSACRRLFLCVICHLLQELGIVRGLPPPTSLSCTSSSSNNGPANQVPKQDTCKTNADGGGGGTVDSDLFHQNAKITLTATTTTTNTKTSNHASQGTVTWKKPAWQRLFEKKTNYNYYHRRPSSDGRAATPSRFQNGARARAVGAGGAGNAESDRQKILVDQWLVHCLQLLQKLALKEKDEKGHWSCTVDSDAGENSTLLLHQLHHESFLPPTDLVKWYVETAAGDSDSLGTMPPPRHYPFSNKHGAPAPVTAGNKTNPTATSSSCLGGCTLPRVDPGAKLLTMISLYQALVVE